MRTGVIATAAWSMREVWRTSRPLALAHTVLVALDSLVPALQVFFVAKLTTAVTNPSDTGEIVRWILLTALVVGLSGSIRDATMTVGQVVSRKVAAESQARFAEAMAALSPAELADAALATSARTARDAITSNVAQHGTYALNSLRAVMAMVFLVVALWQYSPLAAIIIALSSLPILYAFTRVSRIEAARWPLMSHESKLANYYTDQLVYERTAVELASLGTGFRLARLAAARYRENARIFLVAMFTSSGWIVAAGVVSAVLFGCALALICLGRDVTPAAVASGVVAVMAGMAATSDAGYTFGGVIAGTPPVGMYRAFVNRLHGRSEAKEVPSRHIESIRLDNVEFSYPNASCAALAGITLEVRRGEIIGLVGANGAGKSTVVRVLTGLQTPASGRALIDGIDVTSLDGPEQRSIFGVLSQDFGRYELTVRGAVLLGSPRESVSDDEVWRALESAKAAGFVRALSGGLDAQLGQQWGGVGLSGGQWQRLALARIALRNSPVWVLDEPTSSVDAETEEEIFDELAKSRAGRVTVVVSHRAWTLRSMDRIYVLDAGRIVQVGTYDELARVPGRFREMFERQAEE